MKRLLALMAAAFMAVTPMSAQAGPTQQAFARGAVVALRGTVHLWIAGDDGMLHWAGDTRALAGRFVDWGNRVEFGVDQIRGFRRGDPWLSAGLVKIGDPIYFVKWEADQARPTLLHIQSIDDVELFGINATNYGAMVLDRTAWETRFGMSTALLPKGELQPAASTRPGASRANPVPLGTGVDVGDGWTVAVLSVVPNANSLVAAENRFNDPPKPGNQFFLARVRVTRTDSTADSFSDADLEAVGTANVGYTTFTNRCGVIPDGLPRNQVFSGGSLTGNVCWQIASTDVSSLEAYYRTGFGSDARYTYFALR